MKIKESVASKLLLSERGEIKTVYKLRALSVMQETHARLQGSSGNFGPDAASGRTTTGPSLLHASGLARIVSCSRADIHIGLGALGAAGQHQA